MTIQIFATKEKKDGIDKNVERYSFNNINKIQLEKILKRLKGSLNDTRKKKMNPKVPFLLNLFLPFKVESFVQGDYIGGGAVLGSQALGGILWITGYIISGTAKGPEQGITGLTIMGIGIGTISAAHIASLIIPFTFANRYNANLRKKLGISLAGFEPNFDIGINGFQLSFKKSY